MTTKTKKKIKWSAEALERNRQKRLQKKAAWLTKEVDQTTLAPTPAPASVSPPVPPTPADITSVPKIQTDAPHVRTPLEMELDASFSNGKGDPLPNPRDITKIAAKPNPNGYVAPINGLPIGGLGDQFMSHGHISDQAIQPPPVLSETFMQNPVQSDEVTALRTRVAELEKAAQTVTSGLPQWVGKEVSVLFPCMKTTNPVTMVCLLAMALDFGKDRIRFDFHFGDSMIYHARDALAHRFLQSESKWALFVDDDMILPIGRPDHIMQYANLEGTYPRQRLEHHVLTRLMSHGKTLVGATYFGRRSNGPPMFYEALHDISANRSARAAANELRPTRWVGTGCMLVHRSVFEAIRGKFPNIAPTKDYEYWSFFRPTEHGGEDVSFCLRAQAAGHQPHVDLGCHALHIGYMPYAAHNTKDALGAGMGGL